MCTFNKTLGRMCTFNTFRKPNNDRQNIHFHDRKLWLIKISRKHILVDIKKASDWKRCVIINRKPHLQYSCNTIFLCHYLSWERFRNKSIKRNSAVGKRWTGNSEVLGRTPFNYIIISAFIGMAAKNLLDCTTHTVQ